MRDDSVREIDTTFGIPFRSPLDNVKYMTNIILLIDEDARLVQQPLSYL
jgi:hypothetical protein